MICPYCRTEFKDVNSKYCPYCGEVLSKVPARKKGIDRKRARSVAICAVLAVAVVAVVFISAQSLATPVRTETEEIITVPVDDEPVEPVQPVLPPYSIAIGDSYIELFGDFRTGRLSASLLPSGQVEITLGSEYAGNYSRFVWLFSDDMTGQRYYITKDQPTMSWLQPDIGIYEVSLFCFRQSSDSEVAASFNGPIIYHGDMERTFAWEFSGRNFSMNLVIPESEYQSEREKDLSTDSYRFGSSKDDVYRMISTDGIVSKV
ncbi:MAG: hypothetical protein IJ856_06105, partial [Candidatus Methanomethylophilaceae archaeon]|nr:hypothetical protein [Candidatus Methanomethylophilaceae archaeon]